MFEEILQQIQAYDTIIIHRHNSPDGDALGSQIGLKHIIQDNFPEKNVYTVGDGTRRYAFMDGSVMDEISDEVYNGALAIIKITFNGNNINIIAFLSGHLRFLHIRNAFAWIKNHNLNAFLVFKSF